MEVYESILHVFTSIVILVGFAIVFFKLKYHTTTGKSTKSNITELLFGAIWLPIPIDKDVDLKEKRKIISLNFGLKLFYVLFLVLFLLMLLYGIIIEDF
jgi:hypothetical protein